EEFQVTLFVRSWVVLSEQCPVAVNCCVNPAAIDAELGSMVIDCSVGDVDANGRSCAWVAPEALSREAIMTPFAGVSENSFASMESGTLTVAPAGMNIPDDPVVNEL